MGWFKKVVGAMPVVGPLLGAGADLIGGAMQNSARKKANRQNIALQKENQAWQERMSNTSYQRGTADMLKAGLNPMLAYSQGGSSTPTSSAATVEPTAAMGRAVTSAGSKAAQVLSLERMTIDNDIQRQHRLQEGLVTDQMKQKYGQADWTGQEIEQQRSDTSIKASTARIKEIEKEIAEQTQGANVQSAQKRAQILDQEVGINELRTILMKLDLPEAKAMAAWFDTVGAASPTAKAVMSITSWLKLILGR